MMTVIKMSNKKQAKGSPRRRPSACLRISEVPHASATKNFKSEYIASRILRYLKVMVRESKAAESVEEGSVVNAIVTLHPIKEKEIQREALPFSREIL